MNLIIRLSLKMLIVIKSNIENIKNLLNNNMKTLKKKNLINLIFLKKIKNLIFSLNKYLIRIYKKKISIK